MDKKTLGVVLSVAVLVSLVVTLVVIPENTNDNDVVIRVKIPDQYVGKSVKVEVKFMIGVAYCYCAPVTVYTYRIKVDSVPEVLELRIAREWIQAGIEKYTYHDVVREGNKVVVKVELTFGDEKLPRIYAVCSKVVGVPVTAYDFPSITI